MPTWSGVLNEINNTRVKGGPPQLDLIRRKYLTSVYQHTGRNVILYASKWTQSDVNVSLDVISINDEDIQGIMEVIHGLSGPNLDFIIHSPGGSAEAAEAIVTYLRSKFSHIRVIVPQLAMSAATLISCAADVIVMGKHSFLGPIDPQFIIQTPLGERMVPAQAILEQFNLAVDECKDPTKVAAWYPMLSQYGPGLLIQCMNASEMSEDFVKRWLKACMFKKDPNKNAKARKISQWLSNHAYFKSHGRHIPRQELEKRGLNIEHLEKDQTLQDNVLSVFHATTHTFGFTPAVKIIENHLGKAFIKMSQQMTVQVPIPVGVPPGVPPAPPPLP